MRNILERALDKVAEKDWDNMKCEVCNKNKVDRWNETVRNKKTGKAKFLSICNPCWRRITGAK